MTMLHLIKTAKPEQRTDHIRRLYGELLSGRRAASALAQARDFLEQKLCETEKIESDLPASIGSLDAWFSSNIEQVGRRYRQYLDIRKAGGGRAYFTNKSHALFFLKSVAPTKMVDGAWLYGMLQRWQDTRFTSLIRIYLEELGEGLPEKNHVVLYRKLLASQECACHDDLSDEYYVQGVLQQALGYHAEHFLPEILGFNLGYEQLPLHLLITAYELNELGIDPYYFTLHVTVDNPHTGHAKRAIEALYDALPVVTNSGEFLRRVRTGYKLNFVGSSTSSIIASFNLEQELVNILATKSTVGQHVHSDYCRIAGRTINDWLYEPSQIPAFLAELERAGWFKRHHDPKSSRFWKLIQSEKAEMFGVFSLYEQQVLHDWIAGDNANAQEVGRQHRSMSYKASQRLHEQRDVHPAGHFAARPARSIIRSHRPGRPGDDAENDFNMELRLLERQLAACSTRKEMMTMLTDLMAPANHYTAPGLMATRIFTKMIA
jgi:hypothetical protein